MPKKHDPKKMDTSMSMKKERRREKEENNNNNIAMSSCYPNKGERERFIKGVFHSSIHLPHMCTILINLCDLSSPWIHCLILQYM